MSLAENAFDSVLLGIGVAFTFGTIAWTINQVRDLKELRKSIRRLKSAEQLKLERDLRNGFWAFLMASPIIYAFTCVMIGVVLREWTR